MMAAHNSFSLPSGQGEWNIPDLDGSQREVSSVALWSASMPTEGSQSDESRREGGIADSGPSAYGLLSPLQRATMEQLFTMHERDRQQRRLGSQLQTIAARAYLPPASPAQVSESSAQAPGGSAPASATLAASRCPRIADMLDPFAFPKSPPLPTSEVEAQGLSEAHDPSGLLSEPADPPAFEFESSQAEVEAMLSADSDSTDALSSRSPTPRVTTPEPEPPIVVPESFISPFTLPFPEFPPLPPLDDDDTPQIFSPKLVAALCDFSNTAFTELVPDAVREARWLDVVRYVSQRAPFSADDFVAAACAGRLDVVEAMVTYGGSQATVNSRNGRGETALRSALGRGHWDVALFLLANGAAYTQDDFLTVVIAGSLDLVRAIMERGGVDVNAVDDGGRTALYEAIVERHEDVAMYLLDQGLAACSADDLVAAARAALWDVVRAVVSRGVDPRSSYIRLDVINAGFTALDWASYHSKFEVLEFLKAHCEDTARAPGEPVPSLDWLL